ncbi:hypothetical protein [Cerasicoccus maritimus]|uniref:hypothetical protein n=1 Tax=Cerasicoccus maritimus TaxID=490089 RepID=UPI0028525AC1|nr:hypothetical protein [Cerasicoccus maritimus]
MKSRRKSKSPSWLKQKLDEFYYFRAHGIRNQQNRLKKWWRLRKSSLRKWQQSRPIEQKIREQERKRNAKKLNRKISEAPKKFRQRLQDTRHRIKSLPQKSAKAIRYWIKRVRKMTFREFIFEIWDIYLNILAYLVAIPRNWFKVWKKQNLFLRIVYALVFSLTAITVLASPALFQFAKQWRAKTLRAEASSLVEREQINLAYEKARSAALLEPNKQEGLEQTLDLADQLHHPHTIWWAEKLAQSKGYDSESLASIVSHSIDYGQLGLGSKYLSMMRTRYPESQTSADMELELLMRQDRREDAISMSLKMLERDSESPLAHRIFVEHGIYARDSDLHAVAISILQQQIQQTNTVGLELARLAMRLPPAIRKDLPYDTLQLRDIIMQNPEASQEDRVAATGLAAFMGALTQKEAFEAIVAEYEDEDMPTILETLSRYDIYYGRDKLISEEQVFIDSNYALAYLEWLVLSENADLDKAAELLSREQEGALPINSIKRRFWQALIAHERNDDKEFSVRLLQALDNSTASDWDYMHYLLVKHTEPKHQHAFYRELFGRPESPLLAAERYLILTYQLGLEEEMQILLRQINLERFNARPEALNFLLYLNALHNRDLNATRERLEKLIGQYPKNVSLYRTLAFVYAKSNEQAIAQAINAELPLPTENYDARQKLMHVYITRDSSKLPNPDDLPLKLERALLYKLKSETASL